MAVPSPRVFPAAAILLAFAACTQPSPQSTAAASAAPAHHLASRPHRSRAAVVSPPATPLPRATPRPVAKATPVLRPPTAPPRIFNVDIASHVRSGQRVTGHVTTSSNVASVEVRIATYSIVMQKTGVGDFAIDYSVANVPFFFRGTYTMHVIARNTAGDRDERTIPLTIE